MITIKDFSARCRGEQGETFCDKRESCQRHLSPCDPKYKNLPMLCNDEKSLYIGRYSAHQPGFWLDVSRYSVGNGFTFKEMPTETPAMLFSIDDYEFAVFFAIGHNEEVNCERLKGTRVLMCGDEGSAKFALKYEKNRATWCKA